METAKPHVNYVKQPLTDDQRSCNQYYASIRVTIEHKIRSISRYFTSFPVRIGVTQTAYNSNLSLQ